MKFNPKKTAFGRHETFSLRYSWLTKAYQELLASPQVFESDDSTVKLGVGKNMVNSIRYWAQAAGVIEKIENTYQVTDFGRFIFDEATGCDPYLEDEATIWLLHWKIASNAELATSIYWFFNMFHKPEFNSQEAVDAIEQFTKENVSGRSSKNTLKNDISVLLRMYCMPRSKSNAQDDLLDTPFSVLQLVSQLIDTKRYALSVGDQDHLPIEVLGFAVDSIFEETGSSSIAIEDFMYGRNDYPAPGSIFCLTETAFLSKLDKLILQRPNTYKLTDTAGVNQLYKLPKAKIDPMSNLIGYYAGLMKGGVAA